MEGSEVLCVIYMFFKTDLLIKWLPSKALLSELSLHFVILYLLDVSFLSC
jgi:hypothetical protein